MDEGGDPGTGKGTSYFTVCAFVTASKKLCSDLLSKQKHDAKKHLGHSIFREVKSQTLLHEERAYFLRGLADLDYAAYVVHLDCHDDNTPMNSLSPVDKKLGMVMILSVMSLLRHNNILRFDLDKGLLNDKQISNVRDNLRGIKFPCPEMRSRQSHEYPGIAYADLIANEVRKFKEGKSNHFNMIEDRVRLIQV